MFPSSHRSYWWRIPMLLTCFLNIKVGSDFVKRFAALSHDQAYLTLISLFFSSSWVYENNFGGICFVLRLSIYHSFVWATQAALSSYKIVGGVSSLIPLLDRICRFIDLSHTHSLLASWNAIISVWYEEVSTSVCFCERHDMAVPPIVKTYLVFDQNLRGSENGMYLQNQSFDIFIFLG